jgi:hypothetical protein
MMAIEQFEGVVSEFKRAGAGGAPLLTFWLLAGDGAKAYVEARQDQALRDGDRVIVTGERDSQGTLAATAIRALKAPPNPEPIQWGPVMGCSLASALICLAVSWFIASGSVKPAHPAAGNSVGSTIAGALAASLVAGIVEALLMLLLYFVLSFVTSIILTTLFVSYRRVRHAVLASVISLPISWLFLMLVSKAVR